MSKKENQVSTPRWTAGKEKTTNEIELNKKRKGWYVVEITGSAFKKNGNDGMVSKTLRILAESEQEAYELAVDELKWNIPKNVTSWLYFNSFELSEISYVGTWTDEAELEFS